MKDHVTLRTGEIMLKIELHGNKWYFKVY